MSAIDEKNQYAIGTGAESPTGHGVKDIIHERGNNIGEAADLYGDLQTAEQYGYVERGLKSRHIQFIALGGTIGTGLFLGIASAFANAGPLSVLLGYSLTGVAVFAMMQCLGEMATWLPLPGALPQYCARYTDPALGFAVGWNNWYQNAITLCAEISAAALVIDFWDQEQKVSPAVWITIIIVIIVCLNIFAVGIYGEAEFIFASIKIITILGLLLVALVIMLGGAPDHDRRGFRYWKEGAMKEYVGTGNTGRFTGLWSTLVNAAFSYGGVEMVAVAAGEAANPRKNIPKAVRRVFWRILFFYVLGSFMIGVTVSSNDPALTDDNAKGAQSSPWVIAMKNAGIPVLPHIINAVILTSATSSGNAFLYSGSRYLFAVAQNGQAPKFLLKCSKAGVPYYCVGITASISLLTYMSVSTGANTVFLWFQNLTTIAQLFTWCSVCYTYTRFRKALIAQGVDRNTLIFKSKWQPYTAWVAFVYFALIIVFNGFKVFTQTKGGWGSDELTSFFTAYVGVPIFLWLGMIMANTEESGEELLADSHLVPAAMVGQIAADQIRNYIRLENYPTATIKFRGTVIGPSPPSPKVASFSSRGPNSLTPEILKPDVIAPGVNILAGWTGASSPTDLDIDSRRVEFNIISGTSMSCPHVSGIAALLRKAYPEWSPAAIKSALVTTAYTLDNSGKKIEDLANGRESTPFVHGAGHVDPNRALNPGLVYDINVNDYVAFMCSIGYGPRQIAVFMRELAGDDICARNSLASPGDLNYPSFAVVFKPGQELVKYKRVVTNVGSAADAVYEVNVDAPAGVEISVEPSKLVFSEENQTQSYEVTFAKGVAYGNGERYGSIEWSNGHHHVRSPVAVRWSNTGYSASI